MPRYAITLDELKRATERLGRAPRHGRYMQVAIDTPMRLTSYGPDDRPAFRPFRTARFTFEPIEVDGVEATAWYYHDVLVKVAV